MHHEASRPETYIMTIQLIRLSGLALFFCSLSTFGADIYIPKLERVYPEDTNYSFILEEPFGEVEFIVEYSDERVSALYFLSSVGRIALNESDIEMIQYIKDLSFGITEDGDDGKIRFGAYFEFAPNKLVSHPTGFGPPGCDSPCVSEEKSVAAVYITEAFEILFEY